MKTIGLLGSGRIALEYAKVIKNLGYKIDFASSSSQNSKSWKKFKRENPSVKYMETDSIIKDKKIDYIFSLLPHLKQIDYLEKDNLRDQNYQYYEIQNIHYLHNAELQQQYHFHIDLIDLYYLLNNPSH